MDNPDVRGNMAVGQLRVGIAVEQARIWGRFTKILALSRSTFDNPADGPSDAEVAAGELKKAGVEADIEIHPLSFDTFSELLLTAYLGVYRHYKEIYVVMPSFQRPRAQAMLDSILRLKDPNERKKVEQMLAYNAHRFGKRDADVKRLATMYDFLLEKSLYPTPYCPFPMIVS